MCALITLEMTPSCLSGIPCIANSSCLIYGEKSCVACPLPGHHGGQEVMWLGHHLVMPRPAQSSPGSTHFTYICIRLSVNVTCKLYCSFCTRDIYCMSVLPGRGISPLWLFLMFLPLFFFSFYLVKRVFFSPSTWQVFPHSNEGSKDRG